MCGRALRHPPEGARSGVAGEQERYKTILATAQDAFIAMDAHGVVVEWNPAAQAIFGWPEEEAIGQVLSELIIPERFRAAHEMGVRRYLRSGVSAIVGRQRLELTAKRRDGTEFPVEMAISVSKAAGATSFNAFLRDISERKARDRKLAESEARLRESEERLQLALEGGCDGIWEWRAAEDQLWFSHRLPTLLGYGAGETDITQDTWAQHIHPDDHAGAMGRFYDHLAGRTPTYQDEYRLRRKDGSHAWILARGKVVERDAAGHPTRVSGSVIDVSERKRAEARIAHLARHDALTDLPNRVLFGEQLERRLAEVARNNGRVALLLADLDGFKAVNDGLGHHAGDTVLAEIGRRLRSAVRREDLVARLGGDEFAVLQIGDDVDASSATALAQRLVEAVGCPMRIGSRLVSNVGVSLGVVIATGDEIDADALLRCADIALYGAKNAGRNTFRFYDAAMNEAVEARRRLEADIRHALARDEFEVHYQPVVQAATGRVSGAEALLRWRHPTRGLISPAEFIPVIEETGLITAVGAWVLYKACREAAHWPKHMRVAVNISAQQFRRAGLIDTVLGALAGPGLPAHRLELEITETVLMRDGPEVVDTLHRLRGLGVRIALDDFGTGYSSLSYLRRFPFDRLKIDRSFVQDLSAPGTARIVRAMVGLGRGLGMRVTAEGVETRAQQIIMRDEGCEDMQGYLFSKPLDVPSFRRLIGNAAESVAA